jgi:hypothetical protein
VIKEISVESAIIILRAAYESSELVKRSKYSQLQVSELQVDMEHKLERLKQRVLIKSSYNSLQDFESDLDLYRKDPEV